MSKVSDFWYVRFPDGRVVRAPTTQAVREHVAAGHIPFTSRVRRSPEEEWSALDWTEEFADLNPPSAPESASNTTLREREPLAFRASGDGTNLASRLDPARLQTVGLRGLAEELVAALDSALSRMKLLITAAAGVVIGAILAFVASAAKYLPWSTSMWIWGGAALAVLVVMVAAVVPITQMTYVELSRLRPSRWREARSKWLPFAMNLFIAYVIVGGGAAAAIFFLRWLPTQFALAEQPEALQAEPNMGAAFLSIATLLLEMLIWPIAGFTFLLAPIVVIEERNFLTAIWQWWRLVRRHAGRLFLYESAAVLAGIATLAFALPLGLAFWGRSDQWTGVDSPFGFALCVLAGLTAAPLLAYLAVAHVFIYLNIRYEVDTRRRLFQSRQQALPMGG